VVSRLKVHLLIDDVTIFAVPGVIGVSVLESTCSASTSRRPTQGRQAISITQSVVHDARACRHRIHLLFVSVFVNVYRKDIVILAMLPRAVMANDRIRAVSQRAFKATFVRARFVSYHQWLNVNPVVVIGIWAHMGRELPVRIWPIIIFFDVVLVCTHHVVVLTKVQHLIVNRLKALHAI